jgi:putative Ca2+/H+ antiporter (TMEM165/GDT1 family)
LGIASALFVTELTDKDAILILTLSTKIRARVVFLAGSITFIATTAIIVTLGSFVITFVPLLWVRLGGGAVMIAYGLREAKELAAGKAAKGEERGLGLGGGWRAFLTMVATLAVLDLAGDATEILIIVLVAQYSDAIFVFLAASSGLVVATAFETALGNRLGRVLTPLRIRYVSVVIFFLLGSAIIASGLS